ncbi:MAG TPA: tellurite resistance TerB family protein [Alphaproteobacteria bacterium]|nr:tellurite resistance TerB family protein [Alphaproteobacteria bacterium]
MIDAKKLLEDFLGTGGASRPGQKPGAGMTGLPGGLGNLATGAAGGGLIALLLGSKKGRKLGGSMLGYGGAAVLGGLAYKAWKDWSEQRAPAQPAAGTAAQLPAPPANSGFDLEKETASGGSDARIAVVRAMIAAAKADGHIDAAEQRDLFDRIGQLQLDSEEKAFVMDELAKPLDIDEIARLPRNQEQATEIWLASRLAIDPDDPREKAYLEELATRMKLPSDLVAHLEAQASAV